VPPVASDSLPITEETTESMPPLGFASERKLDEASNCFRA